MCVGFVARVEQRETRVRLEQSRVSLRNYGPATARALAAAPPVRRRPPVVEALVVPARAREAAAMAGRAGCTRPVPAAACARAVRLLEGEVLKVLPLPGGARLVREVGLPRLLHR